ncbi:uncharacterized protein [Littorina saxatilis]|uniref:uncharacterized protein isoform X2 n=1 Tax=Littorina saxatilis TaxID=31220 RepID=UPI0038B4814D
MAASGGRGAGCRLVQEMKRIPARYISHRIRMELSQILDPVKDLPDRDYRAFADRNGLTPRDWQWLDSQKVPGETSSICKVLDYLINKRGVRFTVFDVYKTLVDMDSEGQNVILNGMTDIRRMYNSGSRPGEEHTETPSLASLLPRSLDHNRPKSPPPPYTDTSGSHYVEDESEGYQQNDLGAGCRPVENSDVGSAGSEDGYMLRPGPIPQHGVNLSPGEPGEDSYSFNDSPTIHTTYASGTLSPPSYNQSQLQHSLMLVPNAPTTMHHPALNMNLRQPGGLSPTDMEDLKLPLQGPMVGEGRSSSTNGTNMLSSPERQSGPNFQQKKATRCQDQTSQQGQTTLSGQHEENTSVKQPIQQDYRASCPSHRRPSYKSSDYVSHRNSDGHFCMHSGACNCPAASNYSFFPPTPTSPQGSGSHSQTKGGGRSWGPSLTGSTSVSSSWPAGVSGSVSPWNDALHQTEAKQPLAPFSQGGGKGKSRHHSMPQSENIPPQPYQRQHSMPPMHGSRKNHPEWNRGSKFIFILAADMEQSERVQEQVRALSNQLSRRNIKHIAVTSASPQPMVDMSQGPPRDKNFVAACFKKASIVLMMVSPGYLRYADAYTEGARETQSDQQKLIRRFHEQLKDEYFETPTCRVWPVLHLDANRVHLPSFLREGIYYFYPPQRDTENLFVLLKGFLSNVVQRNMSFGQHGC